MKTGSSQTLLSAVGAGALVVAVGLGGCSSSRTTACADGPDAGPGASPCSEGGAAQGTGGDSSPSSSGADGDTGAAATCPASAQDDACLACSKQQCCAERQSCEMDPTCIQCINSGQTDCLAQSANATAALECDLISCGAVCGLDGGLPIDAGATDAKRGDRKNGDPCGSAAECASGICVGRLGPPGQPLQFLWCSSYCQHTAECGTNSAGIPNACIPDSLGTGACYLTCTSSADCGQFPGGICAQGLSTDNVVVMACAAP